ncbi:MAG: 3-isopropylmalate dehydratase small subunit [Chloroflexi bacterium]|nr:3-isopropylmalate dehydratase small subunit [Chloroflexota bacterium]MBT4073042.1 3-isopropylmalate dehydratase small subunit [Chloroflexota bacterium]MBT4513633.1 3-isopropylmalate dehydratase small subunit [Chloroflexota bacterium]MBT5320467.1 3-isopropylmalate dehydratase small subunit [Chloroflexota bacterium]MBT6681573.1 3-isopropylmalate dehydratase small subunit [Chloroflexota bacterium]
MEPLKKVTGIVAPLDMANVDTDQVIPKQFLKRIERTGFGEFAFFNWRYLEDGVPNPDFILNQAVYQNAPILVAGPNFGSGSSREHAPWALKELGFMAIIAPSFGDIFRNNCFQNGMAPVILSQAGVDTIMARALRTPGYAVTVDVEGQRVFDDDGFSESFEMEPFRRESLVEGLDEIGRSLQNDNVISEFEEAHPARW